MTEDSLGVFTSEELAIEYRDSIMKKMKFNKTKKGKAIFEKAYQDVINNREGLTEAQEREMWAKVNELQYYSDYDDEECCSISEINLNPTT